MTNETLIENYFSKRLTPDESLEFEKRYKTDFDFKQEVDFLKDLKSVAATEDDEQFKKQLKSYESEIYKTSKNTTSTWLKPLIAVAALVFVVLGITFFMADSYDENQLFSQYFKPSKNVSAPIVRSGANETILNNAFIAYSETEYNEAILFFEKAYQNSKKSELLFYQGNAYLALGETENAIEKLEEHLKYSDVLTNRTHWYLALAYLKTKQPEKAKQELKTFLRSTETFKKDEARSLLKKLD